MTEFDPATYIVRPSRILFGGDAADGPLVEPEIISTALGETVAMRAIGYKYEATHDGLTNVFTRNALVKTADQLFVKGDQEGRHYGVIYCDLMSFKDVNDKLGHLEGDKVLREVANRLREGLRSEHDLIAHGSRHDDREPGRLGGDEFALVIDLGATPLTEDQLLELLRGVWDRILREQLNPYVESDPDLQSQRVKLGFAAGLVIRRRNETAEAVIERADHAMYESRLKELRPLKLREKIAYWLQKKLAKWGGLSPRELEHRMDAERERAERAA